MYTTSASLLQRLRALTQGDDWERFVRLYTPLLHRWARRLGLQDQDAADLVQDVLVVLVRKLPEFRYDRRRSFRSWMFTVLKNKWQDRRPTNESFALLETDEPEAPAEADSIEEREYRQYVLNRALQLMKAQFAPSTWQACWETVVKGRPAADVASELGITTNAVYLAKARVLAKLRQELDGLL